MTKTNDIDVIQEEIGSAVRQRAKLARKRLKLEQEYRALTEEIDNLHIRRRRALIPKEPGDDGTVIRFSLVLPVGTINRTYEYAAIKAGGRWYRTGRTAPGRGETWEDLVRFIQKADARSNILVMQGGEGIDIPERD